MQKKGRLRILLCLAIALVLFAGCTAAGPSQTSAPADFSSGQTAGTHGLAVHFIDAGQADCIIIRQDDATMLIDAGNNADGEAVVAYLREQGVQKLDTVVGTHPHEDHIGGLDNVLLALPAGSVIMPRAVHTTKTYEDVLNVIDEKGLRITTPVPGKQFMLGDAQCTILSPKSKTYKDLNDYSVVIRLTFGSTAFLFTGDAGALSEQEMLSGSLPLKADVLKVGHHGSAYSTTTAFLQAVSPSIAVISVGSNDYGHPSPDTLRRLKAAGAAVYQTGESGTIVVYSDGESVWIGQ